MKNILASTVTSALSRINALKWDSGNYMVVDIAEYLELTKQHMEDLDIGQGFISLVLSPGFDIINKKTKLMENEIKPRIQGLDGQINFGLNQATRDIKNLIAQSAADKEQIEQSKNTYIGYVELKVVTDVLKIGAGVVHMMCTDGVEGLNDIAGIAAILNVGTDKWFPERFTQLEKEDVVDVMIPLQKYLNKLQDRKLPFFDDIVNQLDRYLPSLPDAIYRANKIRITDLIAQYSRTRLTIVINNAKLNGILKSIVSESRNMQKHGRSIGAIRGHGKDESNLKGLESLARRINFIKVGVQGGFDIVDAVAKFDLDDETTARLDEFAEKYDRVIFSVSNFFTPIVEATFDWLAEWQDGPSLNVSFISMDIENFKIQENIWELSTEFPVLLQAAQISSKFASLVPDIARAMNPVFDLYERVPLYAEKQREDELYFILTYTDDYPCETDDPRLAMACKENKYLIEQNNCLWIYRNAIKMFKQHVFPFGYMYPELESSLTDIWANSSIPSTTKMIAKIEALSKQLPLEKTNMTEPIYITHDFCQKHAPIFEWNSDDHKGKISRILSGEQVILSAPVFKGLVGKDVIRIRKIDLVFQAETLIEQKILDTALEEFWVCMTHTGDSQFRVHGRLFSLLHQSVEIRYKNANRSDESSDSYKKLEKGDWTISPYTSWEIWLETDDQSAFERLEKLIVNDISLRICGSAMFIRTETLDKIMKSDIDKVVSLYGVDEGLTNWAAQE
ncbi:hypothetical protein Fcan01_17417 [Folsomia candida]|uniref:Uncharacterized protein n=1 Tax=Folsomia candida TaxID=158441 RepID=A0A226DUK6_FOLCA|nr:hypothetical protein Fcan01_17417 [Folsomia candida]